MNQSQKQKRRRLLVLLVMAYARNRLWMDPLYIPASSLDLDSMGELEQLLAFRFTADEIRLLCGSLNMPSVMRTDERDRFFNYEGLAVLLARMSSPGRLSD